jgi:hypothetical protein
MENVIDNDLLDLREAAAFLKRTPRALYNLVHKGKLPHFKHCNRLRFSKKELEASIKASRVAALNEGGDNE